MRVVLVPDKFKESLSAQEVSDAIAMGIRRCFPEVDILSFGASDGGDGFLEAIAAVRPIQGKQCKIQDPLGRPIIASYLWDQERGIAYVELAKTSGLALLEPNERNPLLTGTLGCGMLIKEAIAIGAKKVFVGLGGSATNDGGMGIAVALGYTFYDAQDQILKPIGESLSRISRIEKPKTRSFLEGVELYAVNDVTNPLWGPTGAAYTYAPQKGANNQQVQLLDLGLNHLDEQVSIHLGIRAGQLPGSGAAGGAAFGLRAFLGATFVAGSNFILEYSGLNSELKNRPADLIITGEGKIDDQTLQGKFIQGVLELGAKSGIPVGAVCGICTLAPKKLQAAGFEWVLEVSDHNKSLSWNLSNAANRIEKEVEAFFSEGDTGSIES